MRKHIIRPLFQLSKKLNKSTKICKNILDKTKVICYNNNRCREQHQILGICVMAARQTLTLFVRVQILHPQPKRQIPTGICLFLPNPPFQVSENESFHQKLWNFWFHANFGNHLFILSLFYHKIYNFYFLNCVVIWIDKTNIFMYN